MGLRKNSRIMLPDTRLTPNYCAGHRLAGLLVKRRILGVMPQVVIENPILNSPYEEPGRHFRFSDDGITNEIVEERRVSSYFVPIAATKKKAKQYELPGRGVQMTCLI